LISLSRYRHAIGPSLGPLARLPDEQFAHAVYKSCDAWAKYIKDLTAHDRDVLEYAAGLKAQLDAIDDD
jgi:hypothetical protein